MREIKFRIRLKSYEDDTKQTICVPLFNRRNCLMEYPVNLNEWEVLSIDEYTGLKDKNSTEIYEGDILRDLIGTTNYIVEWTKSHSQYTVKVVGTPNTLTRGLSFPIWQYVIDNSECSCIEVIGNIYDNADLLPKATESNE